MGKDADRDRDDRLTFRRLNIKFNGRSLDWPVHHLKTFQKILVLGSMKYSDYCTNDDGSNFWKFETKARAKHLVDTVSRLTRNQSSEIQWRLDIEKIVYKRFELDIDCPLCEKRLWRSEVEAEPEASNAITISLQKRRNDRTTCSCTPEEKYKNQGSINLNHMFDYRADEFIVHGGEAHYELRPRKPDRVYGIQQTKFFTQALQVITAAIQDRVTEDADLDDGLKAFQFTPFEERARPLIFPFLISEAKTERGHSFEKCERQTAFPIWTLLRMQEVLQARSNQSLAEQGAPFVWFFANRGEEWRLYGCFTDIDESRTEQRTSYNILDLWTGRLDSRDGALQMLLLIDYIFDWARDIYRHGIARLLKTLYRQASGQGINDTVSISLDTDFESIRQGEAASQHQMELIPPPGQQVAAWQNQLELDPPIAQLVETLENPDLCEEKSKEWQNTDTVAGSFRDPAIIETCFECIQFTNDVFQTLLSPFITGGISEKSIRQFTSEIKKGLAGYGVRISGDTLADLEEQWTGNRRLIEDVAPTSLVKYAIIVYYVHFSERWQPRRVISCIIFERNLIETMKGNFSGNGASATDINNPPTEVTSHDVTSLLQKLRSQSIKDNLVAAIESRSVFLDKQASQPPGFDADLSAAFGIPAFFRTLQKVASQDPRGSIEPLTRFSGVVEYQKNFVDLASPFFVPYSTYPPLDNRRNKLMLVVDEEKKYLNKVQDGVEHHTPAWCLFCFDIHEDVPDIKHQFRLLLDIWEEDGFYIAKHFRQSQIKQTRHFRVIQPRIKSISHWRASTNYIEYSCVRVALSEWKYMLREIYRIKFLANLAATESLALSNSIKRTGAGRVCIDVSGRFRTAEESLNLDDVKMEYIESDF